MAGAELRLDPVPSSAPAARRWLREAVTFERRLNVDVACLLLSELVTNSLLHARTSVTLRLLVLETGIRIEVTDGGELMAPSIDEATAEEAEPARGLAIVGALSDRWGIAANSSGRRGTTAWFELDWSLAAGLQPWPTVA